MSKPEDDDDDDLAETYLQHELLNETQAYVARGRSLADVPDSEVLDIWVVAFEEWFKKRADKDGQGARNVEDAGAELRLRDLEPPFDRVKPMTDILQAEVSMIDPNLPSEKLDEKIAEFLEARKKPKN